MIHILAFQPLPSYFWIASFTCECSHLCYVQICAAGVEMVSTFWNITEAGVHRISPLLLLWFRRINLAVPKTRSFVLSCLVWPRPMSQNSVHKDVYDRQVLNHMYSKYSLSSQKKWTNQIDWIAIQTQPGFLNSCCTCKLCEQLHSGIEISYVHVIMVVLPVRLSQRESLVCGRCEPCLWRGSGLHRSELAFHQKRMLYTDNCLRV